MKIKTSFTLFSIFFLCFVFSVSATEMQSPNYRLELDTSQEQSPSPGQNIGNPTIEPQLFNTFQAQGYAVLTDEEDLQTELTFSLSKTSLSFDASRPNSIDEAVIGINGTGPFGYEVDIVKKHTVSHAQNHEIVDSTLCDNQNNPCTPYSAQPWTQEASYGIGYSGQGTDIPADFLNGKYFRTFPEKEPIPFMKNIYVSEPHEGRIRIKVNTNPTQSEGTYKGIYEIRFLPKI